MLRNLRKHLATFVVAAITAGTMALVLGGGAATATHVGTVRYQRGAIVDLAPNGQEGDLVFAQVRCPSNQPRVVGGGFFSSGGGSVLNSAWPASDSTDFDGAGSRYWAQYIRNDSPEAESVRPYAICVHGNVSRNYTNGSSPLPASISTAEDKEEK